MAPHDTNTPKEARRHVVPLVVMAAILVIVAIMFFWLVGDETKEAETGEPAGAEQSIEQAD